MANANGAYIHFHTHPSFTSIPKLSKADIEILKYHEELANTLESYGLNQNLTVIEAVITDTEIAFYQYNKKTDSPKRLPLFVDGEEKTPAYEQSNIWQVFKKSFKEGRKKVKKTNIYK